MGGGCRKFESFDGNLGSFAPPHRKKRISATGGSAVLVQCYWGREGGHVVFGSFKLEALLPYAFEVKL